MEWAEEGGDIPFKIRSGGSKTNNLLVKVDEEEGRGEACFLFTLSMFSFSSS